MLFHLWPLSACVYASITAMTTNVVSGGTVVLIASLLVIIRFVITPLFFSKLSSFPGPFAAKLSQLWLVRQCRLTHRSKAVMAQHAQYGDFVRIAPNHISINNPGAASDIYGHRSGLTKSEFYDAFHQVRPVVFNARNVSEHQRKRKYLNPAFSARALAEFEPVMDKEVQNWKTKLLSMTADDTPTLLDMSTWSNYLAFDIIGSFAFGQPFGFTDQASDPYDLIRTIDTRGEVLNALGTLPPSLRPWMKYHVLDPFWRNGLHATSNLGLIGREAFLRRKAAQTARRDLLGYLFAAQDAAEGKGGGERIGDEEILAEAISFIVGGSDTTSSTITNCLDFIARDERLRRRLVGEIEGAFPGDLGGEWVPDSGTLGGMALLNAVVREVMRVCPTSATGLERVVPKEGRVIAGRFIPGGTTVSMPTCGLLSDPRVFSEPDTFKPERWLGPDSGRLLEYFLPFSTGPRACIGRNFAWMEILKALVVVLKYFEVERVTQERTVIREGFFNKAVECRVLLTRRDRTADASH